MRQGPRPSRARRAALLRLRRAVERRLWRLEVERRAARVPKAEEKAG